MTNNDEQKNNTNDSSTRLRESVALAKERAAVAALEAYSSTLASQLESLGLPLNALSMHENTHVHEAVLIDEAGEPVLIRAEWQFSADRDAVRAALEKAASQKKEQP